MSDSKTKELLEELQNKQNDGTMESYKRCIEIIDELEKHGTDKLERKKLKENRMMIELEMLKLKFEELPEDSYQEKINLRGKIIKQCKLIERKTADGNTKMKMRYMRLEELRKHKETLKEYRKQEGTQIPISEKLGLRIQEISKSIEIFLMKEDVLYKLKEIAKAMATGAASIAVIAGAMSLALESVLGIPITLVTMADVLPVVAYAGISALMKTMITKTPFEQYQYQQSDEYKEMVEQFRKEHQEELIKIGEVLQAKKDNQKPEDVFEMNKNLITAIDELSKDTKLKGVRNAYELQSLDLLRENKEICEQIIDEYLDEHNDDTEKYRNYKKELTKIKFEIFKRSNSIEEAIKHSGKEIAVNSGVMVVARLIMSVLSPDMFAIEGIKDFILPFAFAVINGIIDIPTYLE